MLADQTPQHLVSYYERSGYKHLGESKAQFGGGGWHDMVNIPFPFPLDGPGKPPVPVNSNESDLYA